MDDEYKIDWAEIEIRKKNHQQKKLQESSFYPIQFTELLKNNKSNNIHLYIRDLGLSVRAENALVRAGIQKVIDLETFSDFQLRKIPNLGKSSIAEIYQRITSLISTDEEVADNAIEFLGLSVRGINALRFANITTVDQLIFKLDEDSEYLKKIPQLGKKTIRSILKTLADYKKINPEYHLTNNSLEVKQFHQNDLEQKMPNTFSKSITDLNFSADELKFLHSKGIYKLSELTTLQEQDIVEAPLIELSKEKLAFINQQFDFVNITARNFDSFLDIIQFIAGKDSLESSDTKNLRVHAIVQRLGGFVTLEESGKLIDVTRERVRQLETKALKKLNKFLPLIHSQLLLTRLSENEPMLSWMIGMNNNFFQSYEKLILKSGASLHKLIFDHKNCPWSYDLIDKKIIYFKKEKPYFQDLLIKIKHMGLEDELEITNFLNICGRPDLKTLILDAIAKAQPKSVRGKAMKLIPRIFAQQVNLISGKEAMQILCDDYSIKIGTNVFLDVLNSVDGIYMFDSKKYGLESLFRKVDDRVVSQIGSILVSFLMAQPDTQRGRLGLLQQLNSNPPPYLKDKIDLLNAFDLDWVLKKMQVHEPRLFSKGRGFWGWGKDQKRKEIGYLVLEILEKAGKPMTNGEIRVQTEIIRGVSAQTFQLKTNRNRPELIRLELGARPQSQDALWGLRDRDLPITRKQEEKLFKLICAKFKTPKLYIDRSELEELMNAAKIDPDISAPQVFRMLEAYTSNAVRDNEYFNMNISHQSAGKTRTIRLTNRIYYSHQEILDLEK
jgi:DNA-directed RNA polymerase alpha subunit